MSAYPPMFRYIPQDWYLDAPEICEDDEGEGDDLFAGAIGRVDGFRFVRSWPEASFAVEADVPERPKQIVHGPQRKGRGGKIRRW